MEAATLLSSPKRRELLESVPILNKEIGRKIKTITIACRGQFYAKQLTVHIRPSCRFQPLTDQSTIPVDQAYIIHIVQHIVLLLILRFWRIDLGRAWDVLFISHTQHKHTMVCLVCTLLYLTK